MDVSWGGCEPKNIRDSNHLFRSCTESRVVLDNKAGSSWQERELDLRCLQRRVVYTTVGISWWYWRYCKSIKEGPINSKCLILAPRRRMCDTVHPFPLKAWIPVCPRIYSHSTTDVFPLMGKHKSHGIPCNVHFQRDFSELDAIVPDHESSYSGATQPKLLGQAQNSKKSDPPIPLDTSRFCDVVMESQLSNWKVLSCFVAVSGHRHWFPKPHTGTMRINKINHAY